MDLGLAEIAGTLIIGGYAVLGLAITFHLIFGVHPVRRARKFINDEQNSNQSSQCAECKSKQKQDEKSGNLSLFAPVVIGFLFGVGMLVENVANKSDDPLYHDEVRAFFNKNISLELYDKLGLRRVFLTPEWVTRASVLTSLDKTVFVKLDHKDKEASSVKVREASTEANDESKITELEWPTFKNEEISPLGRAVLGSEKLRILSDVCFTRDEKQQIRMNFKEGVKKVYKSEKQNENITPSLDTYTKQVQLVECANEFFYHAKNIVYRHPNFFAELNVIHKRIEFGRAVYIASLFHVISIVFLLTILGVWSLRAKVFGKQSKISWYPLSLLMWALILLVLFGLGRWAHENENEALAKRAFGYYVSQEIEAGAQSNDIDGTYLLSPFDVKKALD